MLNHLSIDARYVCKISPVNNDVHTIAVDTYTAQASVGDVVRGLAGHKNLESSDTALLAYGNGDGGGGPLAKMIENVRESVPFELHSYSS